MKVKGNMEVEIDIDGSELEEMVRKDLIKAYSVSSIVGCEETTEAIIKVIKYYSTGKQYKEFIQTFGIKK